MKPHFPSWRTDGRSFTSWRQRKTFYWSDIAFSGTVSLLVTASLRETLSYGYEEIPAVAFSGSVAGHGPANRSCHGVASESA
jgi:hypothetical protein